MSRTTQTFSLNESLVFEVSSPGKRAYSLPELDVEDVLSKRQRPKIDELAKRFDSRFGKLTATMIAMTSVIVAAIGVMASVLRP